MDLEPLADKWRVVRLDTDRVDGHDIAALQKAFAEAERHQGQADLLVAHTVKGKGVSFMENNPKFHGVAPTQDEVEAGTAGAAVMPAQAPNTN